MNKQQFWIVPSTHIDLAWKKSSAEMASLLEAFVVRLLELCRRFPSYRYVLEQAAHYRRLQGKRPDLIAGLKQAIANGQLEFVGGMASSLETNMPNGECFVRNMELGLAWVRDHLDAEVKTAWLIDTFGINAQVPQILRQAGFKHLMANRFGAKLSIDTFWALGLDGSTIFVLGSDCMSEQVKPEHLYFKFLSTTEQIGALFEQAASLAQANDLVVMPYTENEDLPSDSLQAFIDVSNLGPDNEHQSWQFGSLSNLLPKIAAASASAPVIFADLNPEFSATFSQRSIIRLHNRSLEALLFDAETWAAQAKLPEARAALDELWWKMAFVQFHDVLTGSHPDLVFTELLQNFTSIEEQATIIRNQALSALTDFSDVSKSSDLSTLTEAATYCSHLVANALPLARFARVDLDYDSSQGPVTELVFGDQSIPFFYEQGRLSFYAHLPPMSLSPFLLKTSRKTIHKTSRKTSQENSEPDLVFQPAQSLVLQQDEIELSFEPDSRQLVISLVKEGKRYEFSRGSLLLVESDLGGFQVEEPSGKEYLASDFAVEASIVEDHPLGKAMLLRGSFCELEWQAGLFIAKGSHCIELALDLAWSGEAARVRLVIVSAIETEQGIFEVPFGTLERASYSSLPTARGEWPAQRFVALQDQTHGLALINRGTAGHQVDKHRLLCSLLRAPHAEYAGMVKDVSSSQHGKHHFDFCIKPYFGTWQDAIIAELAQSFNRPAFAFIPARPWFLNQGARWCSLESLEGKVMFSALRQARSGESVRVSLYETSGKPARVKLWLKSMKRAVKSDIMEKALQELEVQDQSCALTLKPFEIVTLLIETQQQSL